MIESALDAVICVDASGRIIGVNGAACDLLRCAEAEIVGRADADVLRSGGAEQPLHDDIARALGDPAAPPRRVERTLVSGGTVLQVEVSITATDVEGERVATLFLRDLTVAKRSEQRQAVEHRLAHVLAAARSSAEVARGGLELVGAGLGFDHAELWITDASQSTLRLGSAWRRDDTGPFASTARRLVLGRGDDLAGLAWEIGETVCVDDAWTLEGVLRADAIREEGIRGCAALPLRAGGGLVGVAVLARVGGEPLDAELRQTLHSVAVQIGHFAERRAAERRLAEETVALAAVARATRRLTKAVDDTSAQEAICEAALEISGAIYAFLALPDPEHGGLVVNSFAPRSHPAVPAAERRFSPTTPGPAMRAFETRRAVFVPDVADDLGASSEHARAAGVVSGLLQPILRDDEALGVLGLGWGTRQGTIDRSTRLLIRLLAGEASMALTRVELVARLESAARTDPLTGLANVRAWEEQLTRELASATRDGRAVAVAVLDLDGFKALNDRLGHQAGDRVLRTSAAAWQHQLREGDLLARLGGDEFGALLPGCQPDDALALAERLRAATDQVTASVGVAYWDREESLDDLMVRADGALYAAKAAGRDRVSSG